MPATRWATPLDSIFLMGETPETLMHVAGLMIYELPADAPEDYLLGIVEEMWHTPAGSPWNLRLQTKKLLRQPIHRWVEDTHFQADYHVRHSRLPAPGDDRELTRLVSRLHSNQLDFRRPPWELHIIEGLAGGRFAVYLKIHHSLVDGFTGMKLIAAGMSSDPNDLTHPLFFGAAAARRERTDDSPRDTDYVADLRAVLRLASGSVTALPSAGLSWLGAQAARLPRVLGAAWDQLLSNTERDVPQGADESAALAASDGEVEPVGSLDAPMTILNGRVGRARRYATLDVEFTRLRQAGAARGGTVNDALLALCAGGLRRYLGELGELPERPLIAFIPVDIRPKDSAGGGNLVAATLVSLATDESDPVRRLDAIIASTRAAKARMEGLTTAQVLAYTTMLFAPAANQVVRAMSGVGGTGPITLNVCVSNVPGPRAPLYLRGSRMLGTYPVSIPGHSMALNITANSYAGMMDIGFIGCRQALPHPRRLAAYTGDALTELEQRLTP